MQEQSTNKRYYWMKFQRDFFKSLRIKKLRRLAGGDTFTIIYLKLQLLSITDGGYLRFKNIYDSFAEEMAEEIDEDVDNVQVTINYLINTGLMECNEDEYFLPYAADNIGSETASTQRSRECRIRQNQAKLLQCNTDATNTQRQCNVEKEIEKEIEKDKDIYKASREAIVSYLNQKLGTKYSANTADTKKHISARLNEGRTIDDFIQVIDKKYDEWHGTEMEKFLRPSTLFGTKFESYLNQKIIKKGNQFTDFQEKQDYDFDAIEKSILSQ